MRLIYSPAACSISTHVVLEELGEPFSTERVVARDGGTRTEAFLKLNPKGKVPVLVLDDGTVLTESPVILQYLARTHPDHGLLPRDLGSEFEALQICEYLCNTVHNYGLTRLFRPQLFCAHEEAWPEVRKAGEQVVREAFALMAARLADRPFLFERLSIADAVLFFFELHASRLRIPMPPAVAEHFDLLTTRPSVRRAIAAEDLAIEDFRPVPAQ